VLGHLGTGLPYAIGAALAAPDSRVVLLTGDGSLGFSVMEFETAIRHRLPIVVVVGSDAAWGIEECFQAAWYGPDRLVNTKLTPVRWDRMAQAMGGWGEQVERPEELRPALERAFAAGVPACVNVTTKTLASPMAEAFARVFARRHGRTRQSREP
jgi:acetolactate synthase-1/2/3 large subunit